MQLNIAVVDDASLNLKLFAGLLKRFEATVVHTFESSATALDWCLSNPVDLVVVDYMMPAPDGLAFIKTFRAQLNKQDVPLLMATANDQKEVRYQALEIGASDFLAKPIDKHEFLARVKNLLELRRRQRMMDDRALWLAEEVKRATQDIRERERDTLVRLARAAEFRDPETGAHILRMAAYSQLIARKMGMSEAEQDEIFEAAPMHDLGKLGTPDGILLKPGKLTPGEFEIMKQHAEMGYQILHGSASKVLQRAALIARSHHEKFDGSGYPQGLAGDCIPLEGRIVAVADVFDALTSERPYKRAWTVGAARDFLLSNAGTHFDPSCVQCFVDAWDEVMEIRARYQDKM